MEYPTKEKSRNTVDMTPTQLKNIMSQFEPDMLRDDDEFYDLKTAFQSIEKSDMIIIGLYAELKSERNVAQLLGVSRTTIHKCLQKIKNEIIRKLK